MVKNPHQFDFFAAFSVVLPCIEIRDLRFCCRTPPSDLPLAPKNSDWRGFLTTAPHAELLLPCRKTAPLSGRVSCAKAIAL